MPKNRRIIGMKPQPGARGKLRQMLDQAGFVITQPKLNGVHALWDGFGGLRTLSGRSINCVPGLAEHLRLHYPDDCLEGEIYRTGMTDTERAAFARRSTPLENQDDFCLWVFDLPPLGPGKHSQGPMQGKRCGDLANLAQTDRVITLACNEAVSEKGITVIMAEHLNAGFEGIIVRHPYKPWEPKQSPHLLKIKPGCEDDYEILAVNLRTLTLLLDGDGEEFSVQAFALGSRSLENVFWAQGDKLIGRRALIRYQDTSGGHPGFGAVCVGLVR
jgi:hypothetical protein